MAIIDASYCEVSFPCKSGLTRHANECRKRRAREGLSLVIGSLCCVLFGYGRWLPCALLLFGLVGSLFSVDVFRC